MATTHDLPAYDNLQPGPYQESLPSYQLSTPYSTSQSLLPTKHVFALKDDNRSLWLKMVVMSGAESSKMLPLVKQGQALTGELELNLENPQNISSIDVEVLCYQLVTAYLGDIRTVHKSSSNIWNASLGHPDTGASPGKSIKLKGQFNWQFSFSLPDTLIPDAILAKDWGLPSSLPFPPSVPDDGGVRFLNYSLAVKVKRSGFLSIDSELLTRFYYIPKAAPAPPSHLRQLAYEEHSPPLGPELDPLGWTDIPVDELHGKVKGSKVVVHLKLSLSNPLTYTIGTFIPVLLTFRCSDPYTLDLLYNIGTPVVELVHDYKFNAGMTKPWVDVSSYKFRFEHVCDAKWKHPEQEQLGGGDERTLVGEIPLKSMLCPTFTFGQLYGKYKVEMAGFKAIGFSSEMKTLAKTEVTLVSEYAPGPRPVSRVR